MTSPDLSHVKTDSGENTNTKRQNPKSKQTQELSGTRSGNQKGKKKKWAQIAESPEVVPWPAATELGRATESREPIGMPNSLEK